MGNSYSSSSTEIINTIVEIFDENNNNTENQNKNKTSSEIIIHKFLKLEKELRDLDNPFFWSIYTLY